MPTKQQQARAAREFARRKKQAHIRREVGSLGEEDTDNLLTAMCAGFAAHCSTEARPVSAEEIRRYIDAGLIAFDVDAAGGVGLKWTGPKPSSFHE